MNRFIPSVSKRSEVLLAIYGAAILFGTLVLCELLFDPWLTRMITLVLGVASPRAEMLAHILCSLVLGGLFLSLGIWALRRRTRDWVESQAALKNTEERYRLAVNATRCGVYEWNAATGMVSSCARSREIFGLAPATGAWQGSEWVSAIHPDDVDGYTKAFVEHLTSATPKLDTEYRVRTPAGDEIWVRDRSQAKRDETGRATHFVGVIEDITDRVRARRASVENERRLKKFAGLAADLLWETDASMTFTYVSGKMTEFFGSLERSPIGLSNFEVMKLLGLEHVPGEAETHRAALANREPYRDVMQTYRDALGRTRLLAVSGEPKFDEQGDFSGYIGMARDLTDWQEANEARRIHEARLEALIENAPLHILFKDTGGRYTRVNRHASAFAGIAPEEMIGKTSRDINPDTFADAHDAADREVLNTGQALTIENRQQTLQGPRDLLTRKFPLYDADGEIEGLGIFSFDITDMKEKDRSLQLSQSRFRDFAHSASDWFWETDDALRFTDLSDRFEEVTGVPRAAVLGRTLESIAFDGRVEHKPETWIKLEAVLNAREPFRDFQYQIRSADGSNRIIEFSGVPAYDHANCFIGYRGSARDVTERRQAEAALQKSEEFLRLITDNLPVWICYVDRQHRFRFVNAEFAGEYDVTPQEMVGQDIWASSPPEHKDKVLPHMERAFAGDRVQYEDEYEWFGGQKRCFRSSLVPHIEDGVVQGLIAMRQDVTALKQAEAEAHYRARRIQAIADGVPALIIYMDKDLRFAFHNRTAEQWYARPSAEIAGRTIADILGEGTAARFEPYLRNVLKGEPVTVKDRVLYPDKVLRNIEAHWVPDVSDGEVRGIYGFVVDVSRQNELEENLRQSQKLEAVGQLTGGIAHDFNNLLLAIQANLDLIEGDEAATALTGYIGSAQKAVDRAADLTRRLLAFSRRQQLKPDVIDLQAMLPDFARLLRRTLGAGIEVKVGHIAAESRVMADLGQLENALLNLAINARDAMPDGGELTLDVDSVTITERKGRRGFAHDPGTYIRINVRDTGAGMSEAVCRKAFEPFFTTKEVGQGTGLGLSMVHGFMEQSGGFAEIESEPSVGTSVQLCLPQVCALALESAVEPEPACQKGNGVVLLVEDDRLVRDATAQSLTRLGYEVLEAEDGIKAKALVDDRDDIDLVFSDIMMPGGVSGVALAQHIQEMRPDLPVLLTTGYPGDTYRAGIADVPFDILQKPYNRARLGAAIKDAMTRVRGEKADAA
ncbi:MAG: PAS domain S-box protein [Bauldia litoralis]